MTETTNHLSLMTKETNNPSLMTNNRNMKIKKFLNRFVFDIKSYKLSVISSSRAFTLVEMLIAIGLFSIVITIAMGGFVRALRSQRQIVALIAANSNVSLVMEQMSREMRTGYYFCEDTLIASCDFENNSNISFLNGRGENIVYYSVVSPSGNGRIFRAVNGGEGSQLTADNVNIRNLKFNLHGGVLDSNYPARVVVRASVSPAGNSFNVSDVVTNIQTTVSTRGFGS